MVKLKNSLKKKKGITLMELLAVIVIMGILAAISIPSYIYLFKDGEYEALQAQEREVNKLVDSSVLAKRGVPLKASSGRGIAKGIYSTEYVTTKCQLVTNQPPCELDLAIYKKDKKLNSDIEGAFFVFPTQQDPDKPIAWGQPVINDSQRSYGISVSRGYPVELIELLSKAYKKSYNVYPLKSGTQNINITTLKNNTSTTYPNMPTNLAFTSSVPVEFEYVLTKGEQIEREPLDK